MISILKDKQYKTVIEYNKPTKLAIAAGCMFACIGLLFNGVSLVSNLYFVTTNIDGASLAVRIIVTCFFASFGLAQVLAAVGIRFASSEFKIILYLILPFCFLVSVWSNLGNVDEIKNLITNKSVSSNALFNDAQDNENSLIESITSIKQNLANYQKIIDDNESTKKEKSTAINNKSYIDRTQLQPLLLQLKEIKNERRKAETEAIKNSSVDNIFLKNLIEYKIHIAISFEIMSFIFLSVGLNILRGEKVKIKIPVKNNDAVNSREQKEETAVNDCEQFAHAQTAQSLESQRCAVNEREQKEETAVNSREQKIDKRIAVNTLDNVVNLIFANKLPKNANEILKSEIYAVKKGLAYKAINKIKKEKISKENNKTLDSNIILLPMTNINK